MYGLLLMEGMRFVLRWFPLSVYKVEVIRRKKQRVAIYGFLATKDLICSCTIKTNHQSHGHSFFFFPFPLKITCSSMGAPANFNPQPTHRYYSAKPEFYFAKAIYPDFIILIPVYLIHPMIPLPLLFSKFEVFQPLSWWKGT